MKVNSILHRVGAGFLLFTAVMAWPAQADDNSWNVAVLDKILAAVPPGGKLAQVGDMQILVSRLTAWRDQLAGQPSPQLAFSGVAAKWPGGVIPYTFGPSVSPAHQKVFLDCAEEWATFANLQFVPRTTQTNYVTVQQADLPGEGGQSAVGMVGGQQFLSISPGSWNHATVCHELGHTLGLVHEHQRSDRDSYVTILTNNITPGYEGDFVKLADSQDEGPYDFLSVMHYLRNAFSKNGQDTIEPLPAYQEYTDIMGHPDPVLSQGDRAGMAAVYGVGPAISSTVTNTQDSGPGSLRTALYYAFDHPNTTVTFDIPTSDPGYSNQVFNIQPTDQLPQLAHATTIDGGTEPTQSNPDGPAILLNGALAPSSDTYADGLRLAGTNCTVRSLIINGFSADGVAIDSSNASGNVVSGCYLGTDATGNLAVSNAVCSLEIKNGASSNLVGGLTATDRNVISGSHYQGLVIRDPGTRGNTVEGNYIGLTATGTAAVSNAWSGVAIFNGAQSNLIGGTMTGAGNVISGNGEQGVTISDSGSSGNRIEGNYIGLGPSGATPIPNGWEGVQIFGGAANNVVGAPGGGNVISGNQLQGVAISGTNSTRNLIESNFIGLDADGIVAISNGWSGVELFGGASENIIAANLISGNGNYGVLIHNTGCNRNTLFANTIGLNAVGAVAANGYSGVGIFDGAQWNAVGGNSPVVRNVISGNNHHGIVIAGSNVMSNYVQGNYIGVSASGAAAAGNGWAGVAIYGGAQFNVIGRQTPRTPYAGNVISGNGNQGVLVSDSGTSGNCVQGNLIGVDITGNAALPNNYSGIGVFNGAQSNLFGGSLPGQGNVISGNGSQGVVFANAGTSGNILAGNYIGVNAAGTAAVSNTWSGVELDGGAGGNLVGGGIGARNVISGNGNYGVAIDTGSTANVIQGNTIGLDALGSVPIPNAYSGVAVFSGAQSNQIGGTGLGNANFIAGNQYDGVQMSDAGTTNNSIRGNSIFGNGGLGIDEYNGANRSTAAPVLTSAVLGIGTAISGTLNSLPNTLFHVDFYANPPPAPPAQAATWLGSEDITTDGSGAAGISASVASVVPAGDIVTATATDPAGNTSPLSAGVAVTTTDSVGDGIPDAWRAKYFGSSGNTTNSQSAIWADPDGDGMNNYQEFVSGTNPTNAASVFRIGTVAKAGMDINIAFPSAPGIVYRLQARNNLVTDGWSTLADQILGVGGVMQFTEPGVAALPNRFYRLEVLR